MTLLALVDDRAPVCHGFARCCTCDRCLDRELRSQVLAHEGRPNAASLAKRDSDAYFTTPWRFDRGVPPRRLSG